MNKLFSIMAVAAALTGCGKTEPIGPTYDQLLQTRNSEEQILKRLESDRWAEEERIALRDQRINNMVLQIQSVFDRTDNQLDELEASIGKKLPREEREYVSDLPEVVAARKKAKEENDLTRLEIQKITDEIESQKKRVERAKTALNEAEKMRDAKQK